MHGVTTRDMEKSGEKLGFARLKDQYDPSSTKNAHELRLTLLGGVTENFGNVCPEIHALIQCRLNEIRVDYVIEQGYSRSVYVEPTYSGR